MVGYSTKQDSGAKHCSARQSEVVALKRQAAPPGLCACLIPRTRINALTHKLSLSLSLSQTHTQALFGRIHSAILRLSE